MISHCGGQARPRTIDVTQIARWNYRSKTMNRVFGTPHRAVFVMTLIILAGGWIRNYLCAPCQRAHN